MAVFEVNFVAERNGKAAIMRYWERDWSLLYRFWQLLSSEVLGRAPIVIPCLELCVIYGELSPPSFSGKVSDAYCCLRVSII